MNRYSQRTEEDIGSLETIVIGNCELLNMGARKLTKPSAKATYNLKHSCLYSAWTITCKLKGFYANYFNNLFLILGFKLILNTKWYFLGNAHVHNCPLTPSACVYACTCMCVTVHVCSGKHVCMYRVRLSLVLIGTSILPV